MKKILLSAISLIMTVSFLVGAPVTEKETDTHSLQKEKSARKNKDHSLVKSEAEIFVEIEAKILEVNEDAFLDASKDLEGSPSVIPDSLASILLDALTREKSTDLVSAPRITVKNGEKAEIKVVQEFVFPAFPTGKPSIQATGEGDGRQVQEIGFELSVTPTVQKNNQIHLQLNPKVTEFDGFVKSGGPSDPTGGIGFSKRVPSGKFLMPIFSKRKIATQVTLSDGATAIIGGLTRKEPKTFNDKIPSSTENNETRSLLIFVSAKIASSEGSPVLENIQNDTTQSTSKDRGKPLTEGNLENLNKKREKLKAEVKQLDEQLNKGNKKLGKISEADILVEIEAKILEVNEDAFLDASKNFGGGSVGTFPDSQASILLNALTHEEGTDLLFAHRITAKNGEEATIKDVQEFVLPTRKPSAQATGPVNLAMPKEEIMKMLSEVDGSDEHPPHVREVGFELSVTPTLQKYNAINLQLNVGITMFDGFYNNDITLPIFLVRGVNTHLFAAEGLTNAIHLGPPRKKVKTVNDKILGSTENNKTRSLLIFVSAKITSAEGSPVLENIQNDTTQSTSKDRGKPLTEGNLENLKKLLENLKKKREKLKAEVKQLDELLNKSNKRLAELRAQIDQPNGESPKSSKVEIIGIGAKLIDVNGSCTIAELIPGGPAEKSQQLEPKDVILKVSKSDGTLADISDMKLYEIVELIKGPKNSKVKLLIQPFKNPSTPKEVSIQRKPFHIYHQIHKNRVSEKADPVPSETPSGKELIVHIVEKGDTVKSIAKKYGSRVTSAATTEKGIVTKVYSGSDSGFKFISYVVKHKENEIIVSDTLAKSNFKVGDEIKFIAARIGLSKSVKTVSYEILDL